MATSGLFLPSGRRCGPTASSWWFRSATAAARSTLASWAACSPLLDGSTTWGVLAWLLVGVGLVFFGVIWLLGETETIVLPVVTGTIVAAVAGPVVSALARHRAPRAAGAAIVLLGLLALAFVVLLLVLHGIVGQGD